MKSLEADGRAGAWVIESLGREVERESGRPGPGL